MWQAVVAQDLTSVRQQMFVIVPDIEPTLRHGPCRWQVRFEPEHVDVSEGDESSHKITQSKFIYPKKGDMCLLCFDNRLELWVPLYWPTKYPWLP